MAEITLYGLKNCDTCRKATRALQDAGHAATLSDVRANPLTEAQIAAFSTAFADALINTRSATWRGMDEGDRALPVSALLARHPAVMKRPVIAVDNRLYLGWTPDTRKALNLD